MVEKSFSCKSIDQYHVSQYEEHDCSAYSEKECTSLRESKFDSIDWQTLITRKMVERKFLANPRHQYRVSQYGEQDCSAHDKNNRDSYEYPSLAHFVDDHYL